MPPATEPLVDQSGLVTVQAETRLRGVWLQDGADEVFQNIAVDLRRQWASIHEIQVGVRSIKYRWWDAEYAPDYSVEPGFKQGEVIAKDKALHSGLIATFTPSVHDNKIPDVKLSKNLSGEESHTKKLILKSLLLMVLLVVLLFGFSILLYYLRINGHFAVGPAFPIVIIVAYLCLEFLLLLVVTSKIVRDLVRNGENFSPGARINRTLSVKVARLSVHLNKVKFKECDLKFPRFLAGVRSVLRWTFGIVFSAWILPLMIVPVFVNDFLGRSGSTGEGQSLGGSWKVAVGTFILAFVFLLVVGLLLQATERVVKNKIRFRVGQASFLVIMTVLLGYGKFLATFYGAELPLNEIPSSKTSFLLHGLPGMAKAAVLFLFIMVSYSYFSGLGLSGRVFVFAMGLVFAFLLAVRVLYPPYVDGLSSAYGIPREKKLNIVVGCREFSKPLNLEREVSRALVVARTDSGTWIRYPSDGYLTQRTWKLAIVENSAVSGTVIACPTWEERHTEAPWASWS